MNSTNQSNDSFPPLKPLPLPILYLIPKFPYFLLVTCSFLFLNFQFLAAITKYFYFINLFFYLHLIINWLARHLICVHRLIPGPGFLVFWFACQSAAHCSQFCCLVLIFQQLNLKYANVYLHRMSASLQIPCTESLIVSFTRPIFFWILKFVVGLNLLIDLPRFLITFSLRISLYHNFHLRLLDDYFLIIAYLLLLIKCLLLICIIRVRLYYCLIGNLFLRMSSWFSINLN